MEQIPNKYRPENLEEAWSQIENQLRWDNPDLDQWQITEVLRQLKDFYSFETGERHKIPLTNLKYISNPDGWGIFE